MDVNARSLLKQYEYTRDSVYLTNQQRDFYEENGYLIIRKLVDGDLIDECKQRFVDICNKKVYPKGVTAMKDVHLKEQGAQGEYVISRIQNIHFDNVLSKYILHKPIVDIVQSIIGPNITSSHSLLINKPPNSTEDSSRHPLHQDTFFFPFRPINSVVGVWTAMEKVNENNGCLFVVPKSHKMELLPHDYPRNVKSKSFYGVLNEESYSTVNIIMEKGDTIFFHPSLLHGSRPNLSKGFRKVMCCHYVDTYCDVVVLNNKSNEKLKLELLELSQQWGYGKNTLESFWMKKCWLVKGLPGNIHKADNKL